MWLRTCGENGAEGNDRPRKYEWGRYFRAPQRTEGDCPSAQYGPAAAPPKLPNWLAPALSQAFRWEKMIESGEAVSNSDLGRRLKIDQSSIARTVRLASLAPDIIEAILDGQEPDEASLRRLRQTMPLLWAEQRDLFRLGRRRSM